VLDSRQLCGRWSSCVEQFASEHSLRVRLYLNISVQLNSCNFLCIISRSKILFGCTFVYNFLFVNNNFIFVISLLLNVRVLAWLFAGHLTNTNN